MPTQPELRVINIGEQANDGNGDTLRQAAQKINANFDDVYSALGINGGSATFVNSIVAGSGIGVNHASGNVTVTNTAPKFDMIGVSGNDTIVADQVHDTLTIAAGTNVTLTTDANTKTLTVGATFTQQPADWNAAVGVSRILNKPAIFSGDYRDLTHQPTIPDAQVNSDWDAVSGVAQILNRPSVSTFQADWLNGDNATLGYIKNKPTVPTDVSQLTDIEHRLSAGFKNFTNVTNVNAGQTATIYTAAYAEAVGIRGVIHAFISDGSGGYDIQTVEVSMIINQPASGTPVVQKTFYNPMYTGLSAFAVFDTDWDGVNGLAIIKIQNNGLTQVNVRVSVSEYY